MKKPARNERAFLEIDPATTYFPTPERCSIIGSNRLNYRVRDGNGCDPVDTITGKMVGSRQMAVGSLKNLSTAAAKCQLINGTCLNLSISWSLTTEYTVLFPRAA